jgi:prepilin-type N-terminal cleavage/methylation domain-containing protein
MRSAGRRRRHGYTLVEVIVVLALIGLALGIGGLALASLQLPRESESVRALRNARTKAIQTGDPVSLIAANLDTGANRAPRVTHLFLPDGRVIGPGVDPLTGSPDAFR